jgi:hypothetical protein
MNRPVRVVLIMTAAVVCGVVGYASASAAPQRPAQPSVPMAVAPISSRFPTTIQDSFVPITPCRIVDTRLGGGAIAAKTSRAFNVYGSQGLGAQGGKSGGCGIPETADGLSISTTATAETANGYLVSYPTRAAVPTSTTLSFRTNTTITSSAEVKLGTGTAKVLSVYTSAATQLIVDVVGYYSAPMQVLTQPGGGAFSGNNRVVSVTNPATGVYEVTFDIDVSNCAPTATVYDNGAGGYYANASALDDNTVTVFTYSLSSTAVPVAENKFAYLTVTC